MTVAGVLPERGRLWHFDTPSHAHLVIKFLEPLFVVSLIRGETTNLREDMIKFGVNQSKTTENLKVDNLELETIDRKMRSSQLFVHLITKKALSDKFTEENRF